jgi:hypothetical protein
MGINKDFSFETHDLQSKGQTIATLRGISADDISILLTQETENVEKIFNTIENHMADTSSHVNVDDPAEVAAALQAQAKPMIDAVLRQAPRVLSKVIAIAADDLDAWQSVVKWPVPMQLEALTQIMRLTFTDGADFRTFVGNVVGLAQMVRGEPAATKPVLRSVG